MKYESSEHEEELDFDQMDQTEEEEEFESDLKNEEEEDEFDFYDEFNITDDLSKEKDFSVVVKLKVVDRKVLNNNKQLRKRNLMNLKPSKESAWIKMKQMKLNQVVVRKMIVHFLMQSKKLKNKMNPVLLALYLKMAKCTN